MKKPTLTVVLLILACLLTFYFVACDTTKSPDIPTTDISSVLDVLDDDVSGITWYNETSIELNESISVSGTGVIIQGSHIQITEGGNYTISGTLSDGSITVTTDEPVNLTLHNANITNLSGPAIAIKRAPSAFITLSTNTVNFLVDNKDYENDLATGTLTSTVPLTIQGQGALTLSGKCNAAIYCYDQLTIENGALSITSCNTGIEALNDLLINGGNITISQSFNGMTSEKSIMLNDGVVAIAHVTNGVFAKNTLELKDATLNITECTTGMISEQDMIINDGILNISSDHVALLGKNNLIINDGHLHLDTSQKVISVAHDLTINNGIVLALSSSSEEAGIHYGDSFKILGGTVIATGGAMITPTKDIDTQRSLVIDSVKAQTLLHIQEAEHSVLTFMPMHDAPYLLFSSPLLKAGLTYDIYFDGLSIGGTDFYGLYQDEGYRPGTKQTSLTL